MNKLTALFLMALIAGFATAQEIETPQPSPMGSVEQMVGLTKFNVEYSRPGAKGRKIFGDLVPYDKMWRTGANASTKITFDQPVTMNGTEVPAGNYALYTIPGKTQWEIIIHGNTSHWGVGDYKQEEDVARFTAKPEYADRFVENLTIGFDSLRSTGGLMFLEWENTRVEIVIETNTDELVAASIEQFMNPGWRPYYSAASFYLETGKDLDQALEWAGTACEKSENAFWVYHLKAKIQYAKGDHTGAIQTAKQSMAMARERNNDHYVMLNEKLIKKASMK